MSGSKTNAMKREAVLAAVRAIPPEQDFVWNGVDEDDRPATDEELNAALASYRRKRGRPAGSTKTQITLRVDNSTLAAFREIGPGWQTRMNDALQEWLNARHADTR
ncbi:MAG: hypothetical protein EPN21_08200 [Methylococcaceae bacterium]|nr:MAG: hypothetical protein EPN21_08200 [Methylococcaceae bacterium]